VKDGARHGPTDDDLRSFVVERRVFFVATVLLGAAWCLGSLVEAGSGLRILLVPLGAFVPVWGYALHGRGRWARQPTVAIAWVAWLALLLLAGAIAGMLASD
jgi:hypothetical protein